MLSVGRPKPPILKEQDTCWRIAKAKRVGFIVDAAAYFSVAKSAIQQARRSVFLIGWDFDLRIRLNPDEPPSDLPDKLGPLLSQLVGERPDLQVYVLRWDGAMLYTIMRQIVPYLALQWLRYDQVHYQLDSEHPAGAAHHQKIVVIDDLLAFCGGIDMTDDRWDTREHAPNDPRRREPDNKYYGPWHDVTVAVDGEAAAALGELARARWKRATGEEIASAKIAAEIWPENLPVSLRDVDVGIARTMPAHGKQSAADEVERLYLAAVAAAEKTIYIESQYFAARSICEALADRLREEDGPEVIVINPLSAESWLESEVMESARSLAVRKLRDADVHKRFQIFYPVNETGELIYVHAKVLIIDDRLVRIGSSNLSNRSLTLDSECDLAIEAHSEAPDHARRRAAIIGLRNDLLAEHLNMSTEEFEALLGRSDESVLAAINAARGGDGRTLHPLTVRELSRAERVLVESRLLDPERPCRPETRLEHFVKRALQPYQTHAVLAGSLVALAFLARAVLRLSADKRR